MNIKISQITDFQSFSSFSYAVNGKIKNYIHLNNNIQFNKPLLALNKSGEFVIKFQNIFERIFDTILTKLNISHETTNSKKIWTALQNIKIVDQDPLFPNKKDMVSQMIQAVVKLKAQSTETSSTSSTNKPSETTTNTNQANENAKGKSTNTQTKPTTTGPSPRVTELHPEIKEITAKAGPKRSQSEINISKMKGWLTCLGLDPERVEKFSAQLKPLTPRELEDLEFIIEAIPYDIHTHLKGNKDFINYTRCNNRVITSSQREDSNTQVEIKFTILKSESNSIWLKKRIVTPYGFPTIMKTFCFC